MAKKLYKVSYDVEVFVMAESAAEAQQEADQNVHDEVGNAFPGYVSEVHALERFGPDIENSLPYNSDDEETVGALLTKLRERKA